jgi:dipeptidyl-peptidase 4
MDQQDGEMTEGHSTVEMTRASRLSAGEYARAERFLPHNARWLVPGGPVEPHWTGAGGAFWYRTVTGQGHQFVYVTESGEREPAFDHARLASALSAHTGVACESQRLPFAEIEIQEPSRRIRFQTDDRAWTFDPATGDLAEDASGGAHRSDGSRSPDGRLTLRVEQHNLVLRDGDSGAIPAH